MKSGRLLSCRPQLLAGGEGAAHEAAAAIVANSVVRPIIGKGVARER